MVLRTDNSKFGGTITTEVTDDKYMFLVSVDGVPMIEVNGGKMTELNGFDLNTIRKGKGLIGYRNNLFGL